MNRININFNDYASDYLSDYPLSLLANNYSIFIIKKY